MARLIKTISGEHIYLNDTKDEKAVEYALYGKARQNTTKGNQLLNYEAWKTITVIKGTAVFENNGITITATENDSYTNFTLANMVEDFSVHVAEGEQITISWEEYDNKKGRVMLFPNGGTTNAVTVWNQNAKKLVYNVTSEITFITFRFGVENAGDTISYKNIMINKGANALPWEKYSGGIPSPNPQFPQPIEVSGESYNLLDNTATSKEVNGIIFTVNENKSVTLNGTATENARLYLYHNGNQGPVSSIEPFEVGKEYIFSCKGIQNGFVVNLNPYDGTSYSTVYLIASEQSKTFTWSDTYVGYRALINVDKGTVLNNVTVYPMIRKASVKNDRYMPFGVGSVEVKSVGKNLLKNMAKTQTINGITYTINESDGSVTINGTATANHRFHLNENTNLPNGNYIMSGWDSTASYGKTYTMNTTIIRKDGTIDYPTSTSNLEFPFSVNDGDIVTSTSLYVWSGQTFSNFTIKPMIRLATDTEEYEPYKETFSTIPTPNGLAGIKVSSGGNYTDSNGQQWICDEVVKFADGSGEYIQRIESVTVNSSMVAGASVTANGEYINTTIRNVLQNNDVACAISNKAIGVSYNERTNHLTISRVLSNNGMLTLMMPVESGYFTDNETAKTWIDENVFECMYALATPITTPLTAEQLAEISTFYPVTNISNDFDCGMKITYRSIVIEWEHPKTDWKETDRFNIQDFNRIRNNVLWLHEKAVYLNKPFEINDMGEEILDYLSYWKVAYFNAFENNIETINQNMLTKDYGVSQKFYENGTFIKWTELNRIENAILNMKNILDNHEKGLKKIPFVLGRFKEIRV